jgi:hypothetical protein
MQNTITDQVIKQGLSTRLNSDRNNCTVLALAATTGTSYDEAYKIAETMWLRQRKKGVRTNTLDTYFTRTLGVKKVDTKKVYHTKYNNKDVMCKMTVSTFSKQYPKGRYFVLVSGHALAINDGEILDHASLVSKNRRIIKHAWQIK